jgi:hypothetical protein
LVLLSSKTKNVNDDYTDEKDTNNNGEVEENDDNDNDDGK